MIFSLAKIVFSLSLLILASYVTIRLGTFSYSPQLIAVFFLSLVFKKNYGFLAVILYLILGLAGLPFFGYGGALSYVLEPSFGYLLAMLPLSILSFYFKNHIEASNFTRSILLISSMLITHIIGFTFFVFSTGLNSIYFSWTGSAQFMLDILLAGLIAVLAEAAMCKMRPHTLNSKP